MAVEDVMVKDENGNFVSAFTATSYVNDINELKNDIDIARQYKVVDCGRKVSVAGNSGIGVNIVVDQTELSEGYRPVAVVSAKNESNASQMCITGFDCSSTGGTLLVRNIGSNTVTFGYRLALLMAPDSDFVYTSYTTYE
jgi:hypothetical protein